MSNYLAPIWKAHPNMRSFTIAFTKCKGDDWCLEQIDIDSDEGILSNTHLEIVKEGYRNELKECLRGEQIKVVFGRPLLSLELTPFEE